MKIITDTNTETLEEILLDVQIATLNDLILYNDDFNTFQHVIRSLCDICEHEPVQAEQCAHIIHNNGKCGVKKGSIKELESMCIALLDRGLSAKIE